MKTFIIIFFLLIFFGELSAQGQNKTSAIKTEAVTKMKGGRYGEAIDLLNRYISANPQEAEGYNLRGLCFEKRGEYEQAVYDFRSARKIKSNDKDINENLSRTTKAWYALLYNKIEGHKREIAINPNVAVNYLEIGKSYKNLGEWLLAEEWYDKYLLRDDASSDEIIRYTEILGKNGHIQKGEPILKRYCERFPNDHRLWSRYGYFTMWLGKIKIAIEAFENALALRPYFKEAMDGLDQARGKGYIYTINDTTYRYNKSTGRVESKKKEFEYLIDTYYRTIRNNPSDYSTRYRLVDELLKVNRIEEAFQQVSYLNENDTQNNQAYEYFTQVTSIRDSIYEARVEEYKNEIQINPDNKEALRALGYYFAKMELYDDAIENYEKYLTLVPQDTAASYALALALSANREFTRAMEITDGLLEINPSSIQYKLLRAQLGVWTLQDTDLSEQYLTEILSEKPDYVPALMSAITLKTYQRQFDRADEYLASLKSSFSDENIIVKLESDLEFAKMRAEQERIMGLIDQGRQRAADGDCQGAVEKFDEYMTYADPSSLVKVEYADLNVCAQNYDKALEVYNEILDNEYSFDVAVKRAQLFYVMNDSVQALQEFQKLKADSSNNFLVNLYLGDSYMKMGEYSKAEDVYDEMLEEMVLDSTEISTVKMRYGWMPQSGFGGFLSGFPNYTLVSPYAAIYADNFGFRLYSQGIRLDLGVTSFLSLGVEAFRNTLHSKTFRTNFNNLRWNILLNLAPGTLLGVGIGKAYYSTLTTQTIANVFLRYSQAEKFNFNIAYTKQDAAQVLYSAQLIGTRLYVNFFDFNAFYRFESGIKIAVDTRYLQLPDDNKGLSFVFRGGKYFYPEFILGYEYFFSDYAKTSTLYYSPQNFTSHSLWADWDIFKDNKGSATVGGKIGIIENSDFIIREVHIGGTYRIIDRLAIQGRLAATSTVQFDAGYSALLFYIGAFWSL
jgi:tetratricopeptide (TPR) repeat protein